MAGVMGGGHHNAAVTPRYTQINIQTSAQGGCIPIGWGRFRASPNLIWYGDFKSKAVKQKSGKGGGGGGSASYTYSASFIMALVEGVVQDVVGVWAGRSVNSLAGLGMSLFGGQQTQPAWSYLVTNHPGEALTYAGTAYIAAAQYQLGSSPDLPSHNFEVDGNLSGSMPYGSLVDANPADIIVDYLSNQYYGLNVALAAAIDTASWTHYKTYCQAFTIFFSPYINQQEQANSAVDRWATLSNSWIFWSGDKIKFVPLGTEPMTYNDVTYIPNSSPLYDLTYDDLIITGNERPLTVERIDPADGYNMIQLNILDRTNAYNSTPIQWFDQSSLDVNGQLQSNIIEAKEICDKNIANIVAPLIGMRQVYIRNKYKWKTSMNFILLEPGDIVTLTDPNIGLSKAPVRIRTVEEDEHGNLAFEAEEFPSGIGYSATYASQDWAGTVPLDINEDPGDVNPPAIFEPDKVLTANQPQVWLQLSGGPAWGGAEIFISFDAGTTYSYIGSINSEALQGVTTAILPSHADPDTTDTLSIDLAESRGLLPSTATSADADAFRTLMLVDNEIVAYGTVTPTGTYTSDLTYLRRGLYGSTIASHAIGAKVSRIDPQTTFVYDLPEAYVGATLYFKFCSFNPFGRSLQDISTVTQYIYTPTGVAFYEPPPVAPTGLASTATSGGYNLSWTASTDSTIALYKIYEAPGSGAPFSSATLVYTSPAPIDLAAVTGRAASPVTVYLVASNSGGDSPPSTGTNVTPLPYGGGGGGTGGVLPLVNGDIPAGLIVTPDGQLIGVPI